MTLSRRRFLLLSALGFTASFPAFSRRIHIEEDTLTIAYPTDIVSWEPNQANPLQSAILKCVFDQPLQIATDLTLEPGIVSDYAWLDKHNQVLSLTFRDDVVFHDGQSFTSEDFHFSFFERVKQFPDSLLAGVWGGIARIDTPTAHSAIVHFLWPMAIAPAMMADIPAYLVPKHYYSAVGSQVFREHPIGSGPYRVVTRQAGMHIVLEAHSHYWQGSPAFKRIIFLIAPDKMTRLAMLETQQADISLNFSVHEAVKLASRPELAATYQPAAGIILLQMVNHGVFKDKRIRLALHHAIDKNLISQAIFKGKARPISTPAGMGMPGYDPDFVIDYNPTYAQQLLTEAGYSLTKPLTVNFYTTKGVLTNDLDIAKAISQQWAHLGIDVQLHVLTPAMIADYQNRQKFDGPLLQGWNPAAGDPATYSGLLLNPALSMGIWKSDDVIKPLQELDSLSDNTQRIARYKAFDRWQVAQGYSIPLFQNVTVVVGKASLVIPPDLSGILSPYHISHG